MVQSIATAILLPQGSITVAQLHKPRRAVTESRPFPAEQY